MPFQLPGEHTVLQPLQRIEVIVHIAISIMADKETYCGFYDKSMEFPPLVKHILRVILRCRGKLDLTSDDL